MLSAFYKAHIRTFGFVSMCLIGSLSVHDFFPEQCVHLGFSFLLSDTADLTQSIVCIEKTIKGLLLSVLLTLNVPRGHVLKKMQTILCSVF